MVDVTDNVITIVRGDTLEIPIFIKTSAGTEFKPSEGDVIRFAIKASYSKTSPVLINKIIPSDTMILRLESCETKQLQARKKNYVYDIELTTAEGYVDTFLRSELKVLEVVW